MLYTQVSPRWLYTRCTREICRKFSSMPRWKVHPRLLQKMENEGKYIYIVWLVCINKKTRAEFCWYYLQYRAKN